jgi:hypothetical protein
MKLHPEEPVKTISNPLKLAPTNLNKYSIKLIIFQLGVNFKRCEYTVQQNEIENNLCSPSLSK